MRSPGRRRFVPKNRNGGLLGYNLGPYAVDGRTGFLWQRRFMVYQKGVLVHRNFSLGGRDRPDTY